jgi:hypothetical protein
MKVALSPILAWVISAASIRPTTIAAPAAHAPCLSAGDSELSHIEKGAPFAQVESARNSIELDLSGMKNIASPPVQRD